MDEENHYEVGYGKPPKATRFQKGKSGNPKGRPKQPRSIPGLLQKVWKQKVKTTGHNGPQYMTKLEASLTQVMNKAAAGDLKAMRLLMQLEAKYPALSQESHAPIIMEHHFIDPQGNKFESIEDLRLHREAKIKET